MLLATIDAPELSRMCSAPRIFDSVAMIRRVACSHMALAAEYAEAMRQIDASAKLIADTATRCAIVGCDREMPHEHVSDGPSEAAGKRP